MTLLVLDNTVLSHFARADRLDALRDLVSGHRCVTPAEVSNELLAGVAERPALGTIAALPWLEIVVLNEAAELVAFARYKTEFGGGPHRNNGEAAVLAYTSVHGGIAVIDERVATKTARREGINVHGTLWLVANAFRAGHLDRDAVERMIDDLVATDMKLPTTGAEFFAWAYREGLLP